MSDAATATKCGLCSARLWVSNREALDMLTTGWLMMCKSCHGSLGTDAMLRVIMMGSPGECCRLYVPGTVGDTPTRGDEN